MRKGRIWERHTAARHILAGALPDSTTIRLWLERPTAGGWRMRDNHFTMRDDIGMIHLT